MKITLSIFSVLFLAACASGTNSISKKDHEAEIYYESGTDSLYAGKPTEAMASLLAAVNLNPKFAEAWNNLGLAYVQKNQFEKAEQSWIKAIGLSKQSSDARNNLGLLYLRQKKFKEAEIEFKKVIEDLLYTKTYQTNFNLGLLYEQQGKRTQAEQQYHLAVQGEPMYCPAWQKIGLLQKERGELEIAEESLKKSLSGTCFKNPEAHYELGSIYLKTNEISKAKSKFIEIIEFFPKSEWAKKAEITLNMIR